MARTSLTASLFRLAELRAERHRLATERRGIVIRNDVDRAWQLADLEDDRLAVERRSGEPVA